jgi:hypothetical protein
MEKMKRLIIITILVFIAFLAASRERAFAEGGIAWPGSVPICEAAWTQQNIRMAPDGSGGAIIVWEDFRSGEADIYAQRINENGEAQWNQNGVSVSTNTVDQKYPVIVSDGSGGAIIAWEDYGGGNPNIYAVRISSDTGATHSEWAPGSEVQLGGTWGYIQSSPEIVSDGQEGAVIVWQETDSGNNFYNIYAQRIEATGNLSWTQGLAVSTGTLAKGFPKVIRSDSDNVIVTWQDFRNGSDYDIYAHRINIPSGNLDSTWDVNGSTVTIAGRDQWEPQIVADGEGGAIITWTDYRQTTTAPDIYAQRISSAGVRVWDIGGNFEGIPICKEMNEQYNPVIINDLLEWTIEGAIIAWEDMRTGDVVIYAEKIDNVDPPTPGEEDTFVVGGLGPQPSFRLVSDNQGGGIGTWIENNRKIFAQKRDEYGQPMWSTYPGVLVCEGTEIIIDSQIISDDSGGAIVAWVGEGAGGDFDIFAQRVTDDTVMWISVPISGRVTLSDGIEPIAGVEVEAWENNELVSSDITNTYGYYEVTVPAVDTYMVRASWMENDIESSVSKQTIAPSYSFDFTLEIDYVLGTIAGNVSGVEKKYVASFSRPQSKKISNSGLQKILSPGSGIAFVELEQRGKVIVRVPVEMEGNYNIPNLLPGRFIARAYNGTIYSNPRTVNLKEGETLKINFVFGIMPGETVFNYPNPAKNDSTTIRYYCGYSDPEAEIKIYNIAGELVKKVRDSEIDDTDAPIYKFLWDCKNSSGMEVASGVYIYIVEVEDRTNGENKKVIKRLAVLR